MATIAKIARIPAAVIGLSIVAMGTLLPELTVSVAAARERRHGTPELATLIIDARWCSRSR